MPLSSGRLDVRDKFQPSPVKNKRMVKLRICIQRITKKKKKKKTLNIILKAQTAKMHAALGLCMVP